MSASDAYERLMAEAVPTGTFGRARPTAQQHTDTAPAWTAEEQAAHRAELLAALTPAQRADTAADFQGPGLSAAIPDADPDDVHAYLAAVRDQRTRAANGQLRPRPVKELLAGIGRQVPTQTRQTGPLTVACPYCGAEPLRRCRRGENALLVGYHPSRIDAAKATA